MTVNAAGYRPVRVRASAPGVTMVGFWKSELAGVLFKLCFFGEPPGLTDCVTKMSSCVSAIALGPEQPAPRAAGP